LAAFGCTTDHVADPRPTVDSTTATLPTHFCGMSELTTVESNEGLTAGIFELQNDSAFLWVTFIPEGNFYLESLSLFVGESKDCPRDANTGAMLRDKFPSQEANLHQQLPWSARIPLEQLPHCFFAAARFTVKDGEGTIVGDLHADRIEGVGYCVNDCDNAAQVCDLGDPLLLPRTVPQSDWEKPELSQMLLTSWETICPNGLNLGCDVTVKFLTAEEVLAALPMHGTAAALQATSAKPENLDNVLAGELLTLHLAMRMDTKVPSFSNQALPLSEFQVNKGAFEGWTLDELYGEGNSVLGACTSNYTATQLAEVLHEINKCFVKGMPIGDYLRCPQK
jgi:hypothetical protein